MRWLVGWGGAGASGAELTPAAPVVTAAPLRRHRCRWFSAGNGTDGNIIAGLDSAGTNADSPSANDATAPVARRHGGVVDSTGAMVWKANGEAACSSLSKLVLDRTASLACRLVQAPGGLPMISTPLPFQRNFTRLPNPLIPLGYVNAMVSPVHCEPSIPLNP